MLPSVKAAVQEHPVRDTRGRELRDLRISVTDRCNFRCDYCMPKGTYGPEHRFLPSESLLTFDEIVHVAEAAVGLGVTKVRLTGGEPLLRPGLEELVARLAGIDGLNDLALTTNGALLADRAARLRQAGLKRLTVSLDSLRAERFSEMSGVGASVDDVMAGIEAAQAAGFRPLRINTVVRRGWNEEGITGIARRFRGPGVIVRFIEYMDVGGTIDWNRDEVVPSREIFDRLSDLGPLVPLPALSASDVARRYGWADGAGEIGIIASVTRPFCGDCVRLRLSAEGTLYTCLFATQGHALRQALREGLSQTDLMKLLRSVWAVRDDNYSETRGLETRLPRVLPLQPKVRMAMVGG
jgi:cyclic pyranopterin phosphate synthase